jgi:hypothetical protein
LRGVDNEITTAARKKEIYRDADDAIQRIAGSVGLKLGAIGEWPGLDILGIGIIGDADCGPCGRRLSREVESSIVYS